MARPYTVYKGDRSVSNVYGSELQSWLNNGWSTEKVAPAPAKPKAKPEPNPVVKTDRKAELEAMGWREIKAIARKMGLTKKSDQTWEDLIPEILIKEDR